MVREGPLHRVLRGEGGLHGQLQRSDVGAGDAAVHEELRRRDERRVVARQERDGGGQFLGLGEAADGDVHQAARGALG